MLYFDTSFLVSLFLQEQTSTRIELVFADLPGHQVAISHWTRLEFASLLARAVQMGGLAATAAHKVDVEVESVATASFLILLPGVDDFGLAQQFLARRRLGLRASDALHLGIAHKRGSERIYSLDKTPLKAGRSLGLPMTLGL